MVISDLADDESVIGFTNTWYRKGREVSESTGVDGVGCRGRHAAEGVNRFYHITVGGIFDNEDFTLSGIQHGTIRFYNLRGERVAGGKFCQVVYRILCEPEGIVFEYEQGIDTGRILNSVFDIAFTDGEIIEVEPDIR